MGWSNLYQSQSPLELGWRSDRVFRTLCPNMTQFLPRIAGSCNILCMSSRCFMCPRWQSLNLRRQKCFQSTLWKFPRFTGSLWPWALNLGGVMREGLCCDRGNFPTTRLSGSRCPGRHLRRPGPGCCPVGNFQLRFAPWLKLLVMSLLLNRCVFRGLFELLSQQPSLEEKQVWEWMNETRWPDSDNHKVKSTLFSNTASCKHTVHQKYFRSVSPDFLL